MRRPQDIVNEVNTIIDRAEIAGTKLDDSTVIDSVLDSLKDVSQEDIRLALVCSDRGKKFLETVLKPIKRPVETAGIELRYSGGGYFLGPKREDDKSKFYSVHGDQVFQVFMAFLVFQQPSQF